MNFKLVLAERPSAAQALAKVLETTKRCNGYLEGGGYLVSWCVGHLMELAAPEAYDEKYAKWDCTDQPILTEKWPYNKKFFEAHREELTLHKAAKAAFDELGVKTLPKVKDLNAEYAQVLAEKKKAYPGYHTAKQRMQKDLKEQKNVELFLAEEKPKIQIPLQKSENNFPKTQR